MVAGSLVARGPARFRRTRGASICASRSRTTPPPCCDGALRGQRHRRTTGRTGQTEPGDPGATAPSTRMQPGAWRRRAIRRMRMVWSSGHRFPHRSLTVDTDAGTSSISFLNDALRARSEPHRIALSMRRVCGIPRHDAIGRLPKSGPVLQATSLPKPLAGSGIGMGDVHSLGPGNGER